jgi:hypothetical protein
VIGSALSSAPLLSVLDLAGNGVELWVKRVCGVSAVGNDVLVFIFLRKTQVMCSCFGL